MELDAKLYFDQISGTATPTGRVQFVDQGSGQNLGSPIDVAAGTIGYDESGEYVKVALTNTTLASGFYQIGATYSGDNTYTGATASPTGVDVAPSVQLDQSSFQVQLEQVGILPLAAQFVGQTFQVEMDPGEEATVPEWEFTGTARARTTRPPTSQWGPTSAMTAGPSRSR